MDTFETSPQTPQMASARRLLKRRAMHQDELDLVDGLVAAMAFNALEMAWPPFPPIGDVSDLPLPGIDDVRQALLSAGDCATSVQELTLLAAAARELNRPGRP
ncbi:hypothetical protein [Georgenia muralis]|uniref:Uncharacterized protein n=1 Tax=Georgenia muralis TaxID=154117 RepID=A0A3N4Z8Y5_9MICO|nr:hypothetical protein [Georgenia muralis]RPF28603.1 hypothetical protein EDD32_3136 [Georgenia muralis]